MDCKFEKVWMVEARTFIRGNVEDIIRELEAKGFRVEKKELIFEYE
jgi:hypothetical protein